MPALARTTIAIALLRQTVCSIQGSIMITLARTIQL
jgi:hypothetical protein